MSRIHVLSSTIGTLALGALSGAGLDAGGHGWCPRAERRDRRHAVDPHPP
jgi:hypothetical protein